MQHWNINPSRNYYAGIKGAKGCLPGSLQAAVDSLNLKMNLYDTLYISDSQSWMAYAGNVRWRCPIAHDLEILRYKAKFWESFWVLFTCKKGDILFISVAWGMIFFCRAVVSPPPTRPPPTTDTLFTFSRQNSNRRPRHLHRHWRTNMSNMSHICPNSSTGRQWVSKPLRNSKDPFSIWASSKPPWQMWFCTTIRTNWNLPKYCRRRKCVHDMLFQTEHWN